MAVARRALRKGFGENWDKLGRNRDEYPERSSRCPPNCVTSMAAASSEPTRRPDFRDLIVGSAVGLAAWVAGYLLTYILVAPGLRETALSRLLEALQGEPATVDMVGWVFYNAHLVLTVVSDVPVLGSSSASFIGGDGGFTPLLYVVPIGLLIAAGLAAGRYRGASAVDDGVLAGLTVVPGYAVGAVVGAQLFAVSAVGATVSPDPVTAIALAGVGYPAICGAMGGALSGATA